MQMVSKEWIGTFAVAGMLMLLGCGGSTPQERETAAGGGDAHAQDDHNHDHGEGHDHPSEGPHHGDLVELGNEEYHGEVLHDDDGLVTIYILGGDAKTIVPIDASELTINVSHDGKPEQFTLVEAPEADDPEGKSSRFVISSPELVEHLENGSKAKMTVMIEGRSFSGAVVHSHHGHAH
ncbi:hypothetical protein Mal4_29050 [Maioricimonas rarisocia]|uniref:Uncharacterized protein n=1 Tax=Maioricimonas rarisocia TaxID=2528026 RepID=A0A517Z7X4_9PLAN|nr:hypothetical protein [Maioricimonas rarisocia]QDU38576.1 hypothetical protein Mal4_29050 [Maioricimonas rarisocia]